MSLPISSAQIANSMATFLLRRLTDLTETVTAYLGPPHPTQELPRPVHRPLVPEIKNTESFETCYNRSGFIASQKCDSRSLEMPDTKVDVLNNKIPNRLRIVDQGSLKLPDRPTFCPQDKSVQVNRGRCSSDCFFPAEESSSCTGSNQPEDGQLTDWCRWPVCAVYRWGGQCPLGADHCPDAHAGREFFEQIDSNGLVRICFESLNVGNKPCTRPKGCCRFFHPPEHIRLRLIRRRHAATASTIRRRRQQKAVSLVCYLDEVEPVVHPPLETPARPNQQDTVLSMTDQNALEAIQLLSGLMDYGQLLRTCAAIMKPHQASHQDITNVKQDQLEVAATVVNRQLAAYSTLTDALRVQLAVGPCDP